MPLTSKPEIMNTIRLNNQPVTSPLTYVVFNNDIILTDSEYPGEELADPSQYGIDCGLPNQDALTSCKSPHYACDSVYV